MRSVMQHVFSQVPHADIPRSGFPALFSNKTCMDPGILYPVIVRQVYPGSTFNLDTLLFARLNPQKVAPLDNLKATVFWFGIPNRLLWTHWVNMMGARENPGDSIDYTVPQMSCPNGGFGFDTIYDYMALVNPGVANHPTVSALYARAYNLVWHQWFRTEYLQNAPALNYGDGPDTYSDYPLRRRGKRFDYFTSCLPWPQKGPGVEIPLGTTAPVIGDGNNLLFTVGSGTDITSLYATNNASGGSSVYNEVGYTKAVGTNDGMKLATSNSGAIVDLSEASAATINTLRTAFQIQRLYERDARSGSDRYTEILQAHFGVTSPDARLQRAEYLGGGTVPVNMQLTYQSSSTDNTTPQGNIVANGTIAINGLGFTKSFVEHTIIMCLVCIDADLNYQYGIPREASRKSRFDFYWPVLSHLGEMGVLNQEIYAQATTVVDANGDEVNKNVFGYQEAWADIRYGKANITSRFRSNSVDSQGNSNTLDAYHYAEAETQLPVLGDSWIQSNPPLSRSLAITSEPAFLVDVVAKGKMVLPMPTYSVPGLIDHF